MSVIERKTFTRGVSKKGKRKGRQLVAVKIEIHCDAEDCDVMILVSSSNQSWTPNDWMRTPNGLGHLCPKHVPKLKDVFRFDQKALDEGLKRLKDPT